MSNDGRTTDSRDGRHVHVVLLGEPTAAMASLGHRIANHLHRPFVDHGSLIELHASIGDVRSTDRRDLEVAELGRVLSRTQSVVLAAAPTVLDHADLGDLAPAFVVWLDTDAAQDDIESARRRSTGRRLADVVVPTTTLTSSEGCDLVAAAWRAYLAAPSGVVADHVDDEVS